LAQNTSNKRRAVTIRPPARLVGEPKKTKKRKEGSKKDTQNSGKLAIRPDHPRRRIKLKLCMVGGLPCHVMSCHVKCDPNRLRGYGAVGGRKWPFPITLASGLYNSLYYSTSRDKKVAQKVIFHPFAQNSPVNRFLPNLERKFLSWT